MIRSELRTAAWLFFAVACLYALSAGGHLYAADDQQKFDTLDALLRRGTFAIETGWSEGVGGERFSWFPLGAPLLMLPGWLAGNALATMVPGIGATELARAAISFQNAAISALLVALVFLAERAFGFSRRRALFAAGALALGTMVWPYAKTSWSEPAAACAVFAGLVALWRGARAPTGRDGPWLLCAGSALGMAALFRDENALVAVFAVAWLAWRRRDDRLALVRGLAWMLAPLIAAAAVSIWFQVHRYGSPLAFPNFRGPQSQRASDLLGRLRYAGENLYRWTLHPNQGLAWFSPAVLLGVLGLRRFVRRVPDAAGLFLVALSPLAAFYIVAWGYSSWAWGVRYAYVFLPFLLLPAAALSLAPTPRRLAGLVLAAGVMVQLLAIPHDFVYLYLREIGRTPGTRIGAILDDPRRGPLALAVRAVPLNLTMAARALREPPRGLPLAEASRQARRDGVPDFWWLWLLTAPVPRVAIMAGVAALALAALAAISRVAGSALNAPGDAFPPLRRVRRLAAFGSYDAATPRTALLIAGWRGLGGELIEVREPLWPAAGERAALAGALRPAALARDWLTTQRHLWARRHELAGADAILVPYPGHLDMPLARLLASRLGVPLLFDPFVSLHDTAVGDRRLFAAGSWQARACLALDRLALGLADRVLADTADQGVLYAAIAGLEPARVATVPVGADDAVFRPHPAHAGRADGEADDAQVPGRPVARPLEVLFYGTMIPLHGVEVIVRAAKLLEDEPGLRFHLVGSGQVPVERLIAEVNAANVRWTPGVPYEALPDLLANAAISLGIFADTPKAARVVPHKVYEAAAMARPVVTREGLAVRAAFGDAIVCVPPNDPAALAAAIRALAHDPQRRAALGQAARAAYERAYGRAGVGAALAGALGYKEGEAPSV